MTTANVSLPAKQLVQQGGEADMDIDQLGGANIGGEASRVVDPTTASSTQMQVGADSINKRGGIYQPSDLENVGGQNVDSFGQVQSADQLGVNIAQEMSQAESSGIRTRSMDLPTQNLIEIVKMEHRVVEKLYEEFKQMDDIAEKQKRLHLIIKELSQHAGKEEMVMYPVMRTRLPNGKELVNHALVEHQEVKIQLKTIDAMKVTDPQLAPLLEECLQGVFHHVREEEEELLPQFEQLLTQNELIALGQQFVLAASRAPTRPHPEAPATGGFETEAANLAAHQMDVIADAARDLKGNVDAYGKAAEGAPGANTLVTEPNPSIAQV